MHEIYNIETGEKCSGIESNWGYAEYAFCVLAIT
jgi:hypothetical protein